MKSLNFANCCNEKNLAFYMRYHFFRNFDDYSSFKPKITPPKHFSWQCMQKNIILHSLFEENIRLNTLSLKEGVL